MFAGFHVYLMLIGIGLFWLAACQSQELIGIQAKMNGVPYRVVSVQELQTLLKDAKVLVYCLTSGMAKKAIATLLSQGYTNVGMLEGDTTAWQEAGLTLELNGN